MFQFDTGELWAYSLEAYAHEEVKDACLILQDTMGLNVNIILAMMYLCKHRRMFAFEDTQKIQDAIAVSDKSLKVFRKKRRGMKGINKELYEEALKNELILEKGQQYELVEFANTLRTYHLRRPDQLSSLLAAMCLRQITESRPKHRKYDNRILSAETIAACKALGDFLETGDFYAQK